MNRADAALRALEEEANQPGGYQWGHRDCITLAARVAEELGAPVPDYSDIHAMTELRAIAWALDKHGSLGEAYQERLVDAGWQALHVENTHTPPLAEIHPDSDDDEIMRAPSFLPCDIIAFEGPVSMRNMYKHKPSREGDHYNGIVGPDFRFWVWTPGGLTTVSSGTVTLVTRWLDQ